MLGATRKLTYTMTIIDARETLNGMHPLKLIHVAIPGQAANTVQVVKACSAFEAAGCPIATILNSEELRAAPFRNSIMKQPRRLGGLIRGSHPKRGGQ